MLGAHRAANQHLNLCKKIVDANGLRRQALCARKGKKLLRELAPALDGAQDLIKPLYDFIVSHTPTD